MRGFQRFHVRNTAGCVAIMQGKGHLKIGASDAELKAAVQHVLSTQ